MRRREYVLILPKRVGPVHIPGQKKWTLARLPPVSPGQEEEEEPL